MNSIKYMSEFKDILAKSCRRHINIDKEASNERNSLTGSCNRAVSNNQHAAVARDEKIEKVRKKRAEEIAALEKKVLFTEVEQAQKDYEQKNAEYQKLKEDYHYLILNVDAEVNKAKYIMDKCIEYLECANTEPFPESIKNYLSPNVISAINNMRSFEYFMGALEESWKQSSFKEYISELKKHPRTRREINNYEVYEDILITFFGAVDTFIRLSEKHDIFSSRKSNKAIDDIEYLLDKICGYYANVKEDAQNDKYDIDCKFKDRIESTKRVLDELQNEYEQQCKKRQKQIDAHKISIESNYSKQLDDINNEYEASLVSVLDSLDDSIAKINERTAELHKAEMALLREELDERIKEEDIRELMKMSSLIEVCDNLSFYNCPSEFSQNIVIGKLSFNYADDPDIGAYTQIVNVVNDFFKEKGFSYMDCFEIPFVVDFETFNGIEFRYTKNNRSAVVEAYKSLVLHMFTDMNPGSVVFTMVDGMLPSGTFAPFANFLKSESLKYINYRIYNDSDGIDVMTENMENQVVSRTSTFGFKNIIEANKDSVTRIEMNVLCIVVDDNSIISEQAFQRLNRIISGGKKMGYSCIVMHNNDIMKKLYSNNYDGITIECEIFGNKNNFIINDGNSTFEFKPFSFPDDESCKQISERIADSYENKKESSYAMIDSKVIEPNMNHDAIYEINVKGAIDMDNHIYNFVLSDSFINYIIIGASGMGKSRFIHTLTTNMMRKYSPDAVQLCLMDFKAGSIENMLYLKRNLPGIKMTYINNNRYAFMKFLKSICGGDGSEVSEMDIRATVFDNNETGHNFLHYHNYMEACKNNPQLEMQKFPRIVIFIDEIQEILRFDDEITKNIIKMLCTIQDTTRAFGIHMIISTQKLSNIQGIPVDTINSMNKILFNCLPSDIKALTSDVPSVQPESIKSLSTATPGRGFVVTPFSCKEFQAPHYSAEQEEQILDEIQMINRDRECRTRVFKRKLSDGINNPYVKFVSNPTGVTFDNDMLIGEIVDFTSEWNDERNKIILTNPKEDNVMMVGNNGVIALRAMTSAVVSTFAHLITSGEYKNSEIIFANCGEASRNDVIYNFFRKFENDKRVSARYIPCDEVNETLCDIIRDYASDITEGRTCKKVYLFLFGIHNKSELSEFYSMLKTLNTYENFIHLITWAETYQHISLMFEETGFTKNTFKYRAFFGDLKEDSEKILGSKRENLVENVIYLKTKNNAVNALEFVPYEFDAFIPGNKFSWINKFITALENVLENDNN